MRIGSVVRGAMQVQRHEWPPLLWSFAYFFALLCGYYVLRPVRDEMGIRGGVENLQWVFTATFVVMLFAVPVFGFAAARFPRQRLLVYVYLFFVLNLIGFYLLFVAWPGEPLLAQVFFVWVSVFNLFAVSIFWSFMADVFSNAQAKRLFGVIAAGGSLGAVAGPSLTVVLVTRVGVSAMLLVSAGFLLFALICVVRLSMWARRGTTAAQSVDEAAVGGGIWSGVVHVARSPYLIRVCLYILLFTTLSTFLYFMQAQLVRDAFASSAERTAVFAGIDLAVNSLTVLLQLFVAARVMTGFGLPTALTFLPGIAVAGFLALAAAPVFLVLAAVQVLRRAGNYGIARPAREVLYTVVDREDRYKSKNFIDTVVYRGGDAVSGWAYAGLAAVGLTLPEIALVGVPIALLWAVISWTLGRRHDRLAEARNRPVDVAPVP